MSAATATLCCPMRNGDLPTGFNPRTAEPCEDCMLRDDLDLMGRVRPGRYKRVRDCAGCNGKSYTVPVRQRDPYWTGRGK